MAQIWALMVLSEAVTALIRSLMALSELLGCHGAMGTHGANLHAHGASWLSAHGANMGAHGANPGVHVIIRGTHGPNPGANITMGAHNPCIGTHGTSR